MKNSLLLSLLCTMLFSMCFSEAKAQLKVHNSGQISFQSLTATNGVQIDIAGRSSFEPNLTALYSRLVQTKAKTNSVKTWIVKNVSSVPNYDGDVFYVLGSGNVFCGETYVISHEGGNRDNDHIENASSILSGLTGYYYENHEYEGLDPDYEDNPEVDPEAIEGLMSDLQIDRGLCLSSEEVGRVLPEAIRHDPAGKVFINYTSVIPVLIEGFKEQQAEIERLRKVLEENGLLE